jgi:transposase
MSTKELSRVEVMGRLQEKRLTQKEAAKILGISERQVKRLWKRYRAKGVSGLVSRRRGKPSNNRVMVETVQAAVDWLHNRYADFGPTWHVRNW